MFLFPLSNRHVPRTTRQSSWHRYRAVNVQTCYSYTDNDINTLRLNINPKPNRSEGLLSPTYKHPPTPSLAPSGGGGLSDLICSSAPSITWFPSTESQNSNNKLNSRKSQMKILSPLVQSRHGKKIKKEKKRRNTPDQSISLLWSLLPS